MPTLQLQNTVPICLQEAFDTYMDLAKTKKWKVQTSDHTAHLIEFRVAGYAVTASFNSISDTKTSLRLSVRHGGRADFTDVATKAFVNDFNARVNATLESESHTLLAGTDRETILHTSQAVPDAVAKLLQDLRESPSVYTRKDAAKRLGCLPESNEHIVAALLLASEADPHPDLRSIATEALRAPVHQAILACDPIWGQQVVALAKVHTVEQRRTEQKVQEAGMEGRKLQRSGLISLLWGALWVVMALSASKGTQLLWLGFINIDKSFVLIGGVLFLIFGIAAIFIGDR